MKIVKETITIKKEDLIRLLADKYCAYDQDVHIDGDDFEIPVTIEYTDDDGFGTYTPYDEEE